MFSIILLCLLIGIAALFLTRRFVRRSCNKRPNDQAVEIDESGGTSPSIKDRVLSWSKKHPIGAAVAWVLLGATALMLMILIHVVYLLFTGAGGSMGH